MVLILGPRDSIVTPAWSLVLWEIVPTLMALLKTLGILPLNRWAIRLGRAWDIRVCTFPLALPILIIHIPTRVFLATPLSLTRLFPGRMALFPFIRTAVSLSRGLICMTW